MFLKAVREATNNIGERMINPLYYPEFFYSFTSMYKDLRAAHKYADKVFDKYVRPLFDDKREDIDNKNVKWHDRNMFDELCEIVKYSNFLTYDEVLENIKTMFAAVSFSIISYAFFRCIMSFYYRASKHNHKCCVSPC